MRRWRSGCRVLGWARTSAGSRGAETCGDGEQKREREGEREGSDDWAALSLDEPTTATGRARRARESWR